MKIGVLCGHLMPYLIKNPEKIRVDTAYGEIMVYASTLGGHDVLFIQRHGEQSSLPPHKINYLGNIQAFSSSHVDAILSISTVGSMNKAMQLGDIVIPHDFFDATVSRPQTFFDDRRVHVDMTDPFCSSLRESLLQSCEKIKDIRFHTKGVYLVTEGPRLETAAEIKFYSSVADIVGMTVVPEVVLSREKGMCFASLCLVCNMATGLQHRLTGDEIAAVYTKKEPVLAQIARLTIEAFDEKQTCHCPVDVSKATL